MSFNSPSTSQRYTWGEEFTFFVSVTPSTEKPSASIFIVWTEAGITGAPPVAFTRINRFKSIAPTSGRRRLLRPAVVPSIQHHDRKARPQSRISPQSVHQEA
jgi:hypothetical protein